jgi:hypothetical protein
MSATIPVRGQQRVFGPFEYTKRALVVQHGVNHLAICAASGHARSILVDRNNSRPLSLIFAFPVNAGALQCAARVDQR